MTTTTMVSRKTLFSRTLVFTALLVVAAAGSLLGARSARADVPAAPSKNDVSAQAQAVARLLAAQSIGNPAVGVSVMQVLWGGGVKNDPPKLNNAVRENDGVPQSAANAQLSARKTTAAKSR